MLEGTYRLDRCLRDYIDYRIGWYLYYVVKVERTSLKVANNHLRHILDLLAISHSLVTWSETFLHVFSCRCWILFPMMLFDLLIWLPPWPLFKRFYINCVLVVSQKSLIQYPYLRSHQTTYLNPVSVTL